MSQSRVLVPGAGLLAPGQSQVFELEHNGERAHGFVLCHASGLFAYRNRCPHWGVDLDLGDARFYADDIDRIYCKTHGALFRVTDGVCDQGPCVDEALEAFHVELEGDDAWVSIVASGKP